MGAASRTVHRLGVLTVVLASTCTALTSCGGDSRSSRPGQDSSSASSASPATTRQPGPGTTILGERQVARLPTGPRPRTGMLSDDLLLRDGRSVRLRQAGDVSQALLLGDYGGRTFVAVDVAAGTQFYAVDASGDANKVGTPHPTYNDFPRLVQRTGHLMVPLGDRGTGRTTVTVLDARTGAERGRYESAARVPDRADRPVLAELTHERSVPDGRLALSPDRSLEVAAREAQDGLSLTLAVRRTGPPRTALHRYRFTGDVDLSQVLFEGNHAFLVVATSRASGRERQVVVRCDASGHCERASDPAVHITLAGAGLRIL